MPAKPRIERTEAPSSRLWDGAPSRGSESHPWTSGEAWRLVLAIALGGGGYWTLKGLEPSQGRTQWVQG